MTTLAQFAAETDERGNFVRAPSRFRDRVTADGSSGFPAEVGRYHLYVSLACPWAHPHDHRAPAQGPGGRRLALRGRPRARRAGLAPSPRGGDTRTRSTASPILGRRTSPPSPAIRGRVTVPVLWDRGQPGGSSTTSRPSIIRMLNAGSTPSPRATDYYPAEAARRDRRGQRVRLRPRQQRRVPRRFRRATGSLRGGLADGSSSGSTSSRRDSRRTAICGRPHHRGGLARFSDLGAVRPDLLRPLQVQPAPAGGLPGALGLHARPLPVARRSPGR